MFWKYKKEINFLYGKFILFYSVVIVYGFYCYIKVYLESVLYIDIKKDYDGYYIFFGKIGFFCGIFFVYFFDGIWLRFFGVCYY